MNLKTVKIVKTVSDDGLIAMRDYVPLGRGARQSKPLILRQRQWLCDFCYWCWWETKGGNSFDIWLDVV